MDVGEDHLKPITYPSWQLKWWQTKPYKNSRNTATAEVSQFHE